MTRHDAMADYNRFAAPMVLRVPGGFFKCGDPWHSMTNEVEFRA